MAERELGRFKGALFGGFDRRSVADYIEVLAGERNAYKAQLEEKSLHCETLEEELVQLRQAQPSLLEREAAWKLEEEKLRAVAEAHRVRAATLERDLRAAAEKLDAASEKLTTMEKTLEAQAQAGAALEALQQRLEQTEAAAKAQAEAERQAAAARSGKLLDTCAATLRELRRDYGELREDAAAAAAQIRRQLLRLDTRLGEMDSLLEEPASRLREMETLVQREKSRGQRSLEAQDGE